MICDLDRSSVDADRAAVFAAEFLVWWFQAGKNYYDTREDGGLKSFARDSVKVLGGWKAARRTLASAGVK